MDDVFMAAQLPVLVQHLSLATLVVELLAEGEADTAPAPEDVVSRGTFFHAGIPMLEIPAGHTVTCITWLRTASQALVMAAQALEATRTVLTFVLAHSLAVFL